MITLKKFVISYAASLFTFIFGWFLIAYIFNPSFIHPTVVFGFIKTIVIYGSIPALIACLIGEVLNRKIKRCREFQFGIPVFIILAKKTPSSRNVKGHSPVSRWEMNWLRTRDGMKPS
ncbi:hypothetical protein [Bacillus paramycoides]|uniref:hypothetical protein n=1 Tax=Bacillus paramycoides TaxID=2026194 RepID=UPI002E1AC23E|nr:hypothetical protein [Bacillus paramycoides]